MGMSTPACRFCADPLTQTFCDLGMSPISNAFIEPGALLEMEPFYPLHVYVCGACQLVQLAEFEAPEMSGDQREELQRFVAKRKQEGGAPSSQSRAEG